LVTVRSHRFRVWLRSFRCRSPSGIRGWFALHLGSVHTPHAGSHALPLPPHLHLVLPPRFTAGSALGCVCWVLVGWVWFTAYVRAPGLHHARSRHTTLRVSAVTTTTAARCTAFWVYVALVYRTLLPLRTLRSGLRSFTFCGCGSRTAHLPRLLVPPLLPVWFTVTGCTLHLPTLGSFTVRFAVLVLRTQFSVGLVYTCTRLRVVHTLHTHYVARFTFAPRFATRVHRTTFGWVCGSTLHTATVTWFTLLPHTLHWLHRFTFTVGSVRSVPSHTALHTRGSRTHHRFCTRFAVTHYCLRAVTVHTAGYRLRLQFWLPRAVTCTHAHTGSHTRLRFCGCLRFHYLPLPPPLHCTAFSAGYTAHHHWIAVCYGCLVWFTGLRAVTHYTYAARLPQLVGLRFTGLRLTAARAHAPRTARFAALHCTHAVALRTGSVRTPLPGSLLGWFCCHAAFYGLRAPRTCRLVAFCVHAVLHLPFFCLPVTALHAPPLVTCHFHRTRLVPHTCALPHCLRHRSHTGSVAIRLRTFTAGWVLGSWLVRTFSSHWFTFTTPHVRLVCGSHHTGYTTPYGSHLTDCYAHVPGLDRTHTTTPPRFSHVTVLVHTTHGLRLRWLVQFVLVTHVHGYAVVLDWITHTAPHRLDFRALRFSSPRFHCTTFWFTRFYAVRAPARSARFGLVGLPRCVHTTGWVYRWFCGSTGSHYVRSVHSFLVWVGSGLVGSAPHTVPLVAFLRTHYTPFHGCGLHHTKRTYAHCTHTYRFCWVPAVLHTRAHSAHTAAFTPHVPGSRTLDSRFTWFGCRFLRFAVATAPGSHTSFSRSGLPVYGSAVHGYLHTHTCRFTLPHRYILVHWFLRTFALPGLLPFTFHTAFAVTVTHAYRFTLDSVCTALHTLVTFTHTRYARTTTTHGWLYLVWFTHTAHTGLRTPTPQLVLRGWVHAPAWVRYLHTTHHAQFLHRGYAVFGWLGYLRLRVYHVRFFTHGLPPRFTRSGTFTTGWFTTVHSHVHCGSLVHVGFPARTTLSLHTTTHAFGSHTTSAVLHTVTVTVTTTTHACYTTTGCGSTVALRFTTHTFCGYGSIHSCVLHSTFRFWFGYLHRFCVQFTTRLRSHAGYTVRLVTFVAGSPLSVHTLLRTVGFWFGYIYGLHTPYCTGSAALLRLVGLHGSYARSRGSRTCLHFFGYTYIPQFGSGWLHLLPTTPVAHATLLLVHGSPAPHTAATHRTVWFLVYLVTLQVTHGSGYAFRTRFLLGSGSRFCLPHRALHGSATLLPLPVAVTVTTFVTFTLYIGSAVRLRLPARYARCYVLVYTVAFPVHVLLPLPRSHTRTYAHVHRGLVLVRFSLPAVISHTLPVHYVPRFWFGYVGLQWMRFTYVTCSSHARWLFAVLLPFTTLHTAVPHHTHGYVYCTPTLRSTGYTLPRIHFAHTCTTHHGSTAPHTTFGSLRVTFCAARLGWITHHYTHGWFYTPWLVRTHVVHTPHGYAHTVHGLLFCGYYRLRTTQFVAVQFFAYAGYFAVIYGYHLPALFLPFAVLRFTRFAHTLHLVYTFTVLYPVHAHHDYAGYHYTHYASHTRLRLVSPALVAALLLRSTFWLRILGYGLPATTCRFGWFTAFFTQFRTAPHHAVGYAPHTAPAVGFTRSSLTRSSHTHYVWVYGLVGSRYTAHAHVHRHGLRFTVHHILPLVYGYGSVHAFGSTHTRTPAFRLRFWTVTCHRTTHTTPHRLRFFTRLRFTVLVAHTHTHTTACTFTLVTPVHTVAFSQFTTPVCYTWFPLHVYVYHTGYYTLPTVTFYWFWLRFYTLRCTVHRLGYTFHGLHTPHLHAFHPVPVRFRSAPARSHAHALHHYRYIHTVYAHHVHGLRLPHRLRYRTVILVYRARLRSRSGLLHYHHAALVPSAATVTTRFLHGLPRTFRAVLVLPHLRFTACHLPPSLRITCLPCAHARFWFWFAAATACTYRLVVRLLVPRLLVHAGSRTPRCTRTLMHLRFAGLLVLHGYLVGLHTWFTVGLLCCGCVTWFSLVLPARFVYPGFTAFYAPFRHGWFLFFTTAGYSTYFSCWFIPRFTPLLPRFTADYVPHVHVATFTLRLFHRLRFIFTAHTISFYTATLRFARFAAHCTAVYLVPRLVLCYHVLHAHSSTFSRPRGSCTFYHTTVRVTPGSLPTARYTWLLLVFSSPLGYIYLVPSSFLFWFSSRAYTVHTTAVCYWLYCALPLRLPPHHHHRRATLHAHRTVPAVLPADTVHGCVPFWVRHTLLPHGLLGSALVGLPRTRLPHCVTLHTTCLLVTHLPGFHCTTCRLRSGSAWVPHGSPGWFYRTTTCTAFWFTVCGSRLHGSGWFTHYTPALVYRYVHGYTLLHVHTTRRWIHCTATRAGLRFTCTLPLPRTTAFRTLYTVLSLHGSHTVAARTLPPTRLRWLRLLPRTHTRHGWFRFSRFTAHTTFGPHAHLPARCRCCSYTTRHHAVAVGFTRTGSPRFTVTHVTRTTLVRTYTGYYSSLLHARFTVQFHAHAGLPFARTRGWVTVYARLRTLVHLRFATHCCYYHYHTRYTRSCHASRVTGLVPAHTPHHCVYLRYTWLHCHCSTHTLLHHYTHGYGCLHIPPLPHLHSTAHTPFACSTFWFTTRRLRTFVLPGYQFGFRLVRFWFGCHYTIAHTLVGYALRLRYTRLPFVTFTRTTLHVCTWFYTRRRTRSHTLVPHTFSTFTHGLRFHTVYVCTLTTVTVAAVLLHVYGYITHTRFTLFPMRLVLPFTHFGYHAVSRLRLHGSGSF